MEDLFPYPWNPRWSAGCSFSACADAHRICQVYFGHCHFSLSFWLPSCFGKEPTEQASPTSVAVPLGRRSNSGADQPQLHLWHYAQDVALMAVINTHPLSEFKAVHRNGLQLDYPILGSSPVHSEENSLNLGHMSIHAVPWDWKINTIFVTPSELWRYIMLENGSTHGVMKIQFRISRGISSFCWLFVCRCWITLVSLHDTWT